MRNSKYTKPFFSFVKDTLWPIPKSELHRFLPLAFMMFFIIFNSSILRGVKDGFTIPVMGAEAVSFIKLWLSLPVAIIFTIIYAKLINKYPQKIVFYIITLSFAAIFLLILALLYPYRDFLHPSEDKVNHLIFEYPRLKWWLVIYKNWVFGLIYVVAELWVSVMLNLMFWQFANRINTTSQAKQFYVMFGLIGNGGLVAAGLLIEFLGKNHIIINKLFANYLREPFVDLIFILLLMCTFVILILYYYIQKTLLPKETKKIEQKIKLKKKSGFKNSLNILLQSKYLGMIAILLLCYGVSINLVEGVWRAKLGEMFTNKESYSAFYGQYLEMVGLFCFIFALIGNKIMQRASWLTSALITPVIFLLVGSIFFASCIFQKQIENMLSGFIIMSFVDALSIAVFIGTLQNILNKSVKYTIFDASKEMTYIPLSLELQTKGKAAVDVIGPHLGKSFGSFLQSFIFVLFPNSSYNDIVPFLGGVFILIVIIWIIDVNALNKEYTKLLAKN